MKFGDKLTMMALHVILGAISITSPYISTVWFYFFFLYSVFRITSTNNEDDFASYAVCYLMCLEIVMRMNDSSLVLYETGKYSCCTLMVIAMSVERRKNPTPQFAIIYIICLVPSFFVGKYGGIADIIQRCSFNLSGPISLAIACIYFYKRKVNKQQFENMVYYCILPLLAACIIVVLKLPSIKSIQFTTDSNKQLSGGFGPNQASSIFGFGFSILIVAWLIRAKITNSHIVDLLVAMIFLGFALLTFSRGGVVSALSSVLAAMFIIIRTRQNVKSVMQISYLLLILAIFGSLTWAFLDNFSGGFLSQRYEKAVNIESEHAEKETFINTTGRTEIANLDLEIFSRNPVFGIGPGKSIDVHGDELGEKFATHTELTRLLAEHGLFGLVCILVLLFAPIIVFKNQTPEGKTIMTAMVVLTVSSMLHVAMRLAICGIVYGIGFANYDFKNNNPLIRSSDT